ncbi:MAG: sigma-70 family RNA polymerase sigma factor [Propionibacteriales bacterium]|nr:sigma-70 family RNA polymerase sigma factor [Propionibacteriales bacterium]
MDLVRRLLGEPSLTAEEEHRLAALARAGDDAARAALLRGSLRLAALRVWALGFRGDDVDDALQVAVLALMSAVARFDPDRGARLATYAWPWITRALHAHRQARPEVPHDVVPEPRASPHDSAGDVVGCLAGLPPRERAVLLERFSRTPEGTCPTPWSDVASRLDLPVSTVRRVGDQALSRLREGVGRVTDRAPRVGGIPP